MTATTFANMLEVPSITGIADRSLNITLFGP
jgi:hypothetical protein